METLITEKVLLLMESDGEEPCVSLEQRLPAEAKEGFDCVLKMRGVGPKIVSDSGGDLIVVGDGGFFPYELLIEMEPGTKVICEGVIKLSVRPVRE